MRPAWGEHLVTPRLLPSAGIAARLYFAVGAGVVLLAAAFAAAPLRPLLVLGFLAAAPAALIAAQLRGMAGLARLVIAVTGTIVVNFLVAETLLVLGIWSPLAALLVMAVLIACSLACSVRPLRTRLRSPLQAARAALERLAAGLDSRPPAAPAVRAGTVPAGAPEPVRQPVQQAVRQPVGQAVRTGSASLRSEDAPTEEIPVIDPVSGR